MKIQCSFLQSYVMETWTPADWLRELGWMKDAGIVEIVLDTARLDTNTAFYPSNTIPATLVDHIGRALAYADSLDMRVWLCPCKDLRVKTNETDPGVWQQFELTAESLASDLYSHFRDHPSWTGWYLQHEQHNLMTGNQVIVSEMQTPLSEYLRMLEPKKRIAISPYFNHAQRQNYQEFANYISGILDNTQIDTVAMQDGVGGKFNPVDMLPNWYDPMGAAVRGTGALFLLNVNTFRKTADGVLYPAIPGEYFPVIDKVSQFVAGVWGFSPNHYMSPSVVNTPYYLEAYKN